MVSFRSIKYTIKASGNFLGGFRGKQQLLYSPLNWCMQFWLNRHGATNEELEQYVSVGERTKQINFILPEDHRKGEFIIAAKFLTSRFLQMEAVARTFKQLWRTDGGFKIQNQGNNLALFVFSSLVKVDKF